MKAILFDLGNEHYLMEARQFVREPVFEVRRHEHVLRPLLSQATFGFADLFNHSSDVDVIVHVASTELLTIRIESQ